MNARVSDAGLNVVAVLVNQVPDAEVTNGEQHVRDLEVDARVTGRIECCEYAAEERPWIRYVLKDMPAGQKIRIEVGVFRREKTLEVFHAATFGNLDATFLVAHVEAEAVVGAELAEHRKEVAFAAADFDDALAVQAVLGDEFCGHLLGEAIERRREVQGVLVGLGVGEQ